MRYASPKHERLYRNITRGKGYPAGTLAALYLLTAQRKLWKSFCKCVSNQGIEWAASRNIDTGWDGYHLERAALSLSKPTAQQRVRNAPVEHFSQAALAVTLHDLTDPAVFPQELLRLVITALWIARSDPRSTKEIIVKKGRFFAC